MSIDKRRLVRRDFCFIAHCEFAKATQFGIIHRTKGAGKTIAKDDVIGLSNLWPDRRRNTYI